MGALCTAGARVRDGEGQTPFPAAVVAEGNRIARIVTEGETAELPADAIGVPCKDPRRTVERGLVRAAALPPRLPCGKEPAP